MIKTTRWQPDTCDCDIEYQWDTDVPQDARIHTVSKINRACKAHEKLATKEDHFEKVLDENKRKNIIRKEILDKVPEIGVEVTGPNGEKFREFKPGVEFTYSFDEDRNLVVDLKGATAKEKTDADKASKDRFGDKVKTK